MRIREVKNGMIIESAFLNQYQGLRFGMSTRLGGVSPEPLGMNLSFRVHDDPANVIENRRRLFARLGMNLDSAAIPGQCHSDHVEVVSASGEYDQTDALITSTLNLPLVVSVADCMAVVLFDPTCNVLGTIHAGWRGTASSIVAQSLVRMRDTFGVSVREVVAYLSPSAGPCCYEVGPEVAAKFQSNYVQKRGGSLFLDLKNANADQLLAAGLQKDNIDISPQCTICNPDLFHSFRRDGERSGRMMAVASLVNDRRT
jgi:YfiH family protein